jgi:hypothetical protein
VQSTLKNFIFNESCANFSTELDSIGCDLPYAIAIVHLAFMDSVEWSVRPFVFNQLLFIQLMQREIRCTISVYRALHVLVDVFARSWVSTSRQLVTVRSGCSYDPAG